MSRPGRLSPIRVAVATAALLAALVAPARAVPPIAGGALASDNVDLVVNLPDIAAIGAKKIGQTLYLTTLQGVRIYDLSIGIPVLLGALELPHWQNEAVDTNGKILLVSGDNFAGGVRNLFVVDVSDPRLPRLVGASVLTSAGHTATCVLDCTYAWLASPGISVVDLRDPTQPKEVGRVAPMGTVHKVDVDAAGYAWVGGAGAFDLNTYGAHNLTTPDLVVKGARAFGWHNSVRPRATEATPAKLANAMIDPGELLLGTDEEQFPVSNSLCADDGPFITSWYRTVAGAPRVDPLDSFAIGQGTVADARKPVAAFACSSHWFDEADGVVANSWYEQGVRFLDVSNPRDIRQIGYYMPAVTETWMSLYHEVTDGPFPGRYVYSFDAARGLDVLRFTGKAGDPTALAPRLNTPAKVASPSPEFGYACRLPVPA